MRGAWHVLECPHALRSDVGRISQAADGEGLGLASPKGSDASPRENFIGVQPYRCLNLRMKWEG